MTRAQAQTPSVQEATDQTAQAPPNPELERLLKKDHVPVRDGQFVPDSLDGYWRLANMYLSSGMVPRSLEGRNANETLAKLTICMEAGACLGLSVSHSVVNIMVVNNRPALWGDALPALIRKSGKCASIEEHFEGQRDDYTAVCTMKRITKLANGEWATEEQSRSFGVQDAKRAGLWGKQGPWQSYPSRMLQIRARAWCARDMFADVLMGFGVAEELQDIPPDAPDKAAAAQEAIEALKGTNGGPKTPTPQTGSNGKPEPTRPTPPEPEPDEPQEAQPDGPTGEESQETAGTDAEQPQVIDPKPPQKPKPTSKGHAEAEPPPEFFDQQAQQKPARPAATRPWHK